MNTRTLHILVSLGIAPLQQKIIRIRSRVISLYSFMYSKFMLQTLTYVRMRLDGKEFHTHTQTHTQPTQTNTHTITY